MKKINRHNIKESISVRSDFRTDFKQNMGVTIEGNKYMGNILYMVEPNKVIWSYNISSKELSKALGQEIAEMQDITLLSDECYIPKGVEKPNTISKCYNICKNEILEATIFEFDLDMISLIISNSRSHRKFIFSDSDKYLKTGNTPGSTINTTSNESLSISSNFKSDFEEAVEINVDNKYVNALIQYQLFDDYVEWFLNVPTDSLVKLYGNGLARRKDINLAHGECSYNGGPVPSNASDAYEYCFDEIDNAIMKMYTNDDLASLSYKSANPAWLGSSDKDMSMATENMLITSFELFEKVLIKNNDLL